MATSGLLINENNIYGLVNPPPATTAYNPKSWQDPSSGAVRWDHFYDLSKNFYFLANGSSAALDTIQELATALGDDASFSTTVTNSIATKAALAGADFTGDVSVATAKNLTITGHNGTTKGLVLGTTLVTATAAELNYMDGVTSAVQAQLDAKMGLAGGTFTGTVILSGAPTADLHAATKKYVDDNGGNATLTGAGSTIDTEDLTVSRALISNASGKVAVSAVTDTELGYLDGVSSAIQTQLNAKQALNAKLTDLAGLAVTANNFIAGDGNNFVLKTAAQARTAMGVDAAGTDNSTNVSLAAVTGNYLTLSGQAITAGTVPVALGGTGSTTAGGARTGLGVAIGSDVQAHSANLDAIAGLSKTADNFIVANGTTWTLKTPLDARTSLGLGALATAATISNANWSGADLALANGGTGASTAAGARTALGVVIGSDVQAYDAGLLSIAALTTAANKMIYTTDADTYAVTTLTAAGRNLLDDATAAAQCTTLGLGTGSDVVFNQVTSALVGNASTATKIASITNTNIVQLAETQTLTNKTLTAPTITGAGAIAGVFTGDLTGDVTGNADTATNLAGTKAANLVYAGPGSGVDAAPSFRALVAGDIPDLNQDTSGTAANLSGSQTAKFVYAAPNANNGTASFRALVASDIPDLNQDTTGTAATVTGAAQTAITSVGTLTALTVDDVAIDGKVITMTGSTDDTAVLTVAENGALTITTTDTAAAAANITITADGTAELGGTTVTLNSSGGITLDADNGTITFSDNGDSLGTITKVNNVGHYSGNAATASSISGLTSTVAELNILDGVTAEAAELNILDGVTSSTAELNILDGSETTQATVTLVDGDGVVISDGDVMKQCLVSDFKTYVADLTLTTAAQAAITSVGTLTGLTVNGNVTVSDGTNDFNIASHDGTNGLKLGGTQITATAAQLNYVTGVTSAIQTQLDTKATLASPTLTGTPLAPTASAATNSTQIATTQYVTTAITNTDIANATHVATANKIVKRDSGGGAAFVNVTASVITTGTSGGVGADVSDLLTRVDALEDSVVAGVSAPTTATVGVAGDMKVVVDGANFYLYVLVSISGSAGNYTYNWKRATLV